MRVLDPAPSIVAAKRAAQRKPADEMVVIVEDVIKLLDDASEDLRRGHFPTARRPRRWAAHCAASRTSWRRDVTELKVDATLRAAVDLARSALDGVAEPGSVGDHLEMVMDDDRVATHYFACLTPPTSAGAGRSAFRAARQKVATV